MGSLTLLGVGSAADWRAAYVLPDGTKPAVILDFANARYDVAGSPAALTDLIAGAPATDASGLVMTGDSTLQAQGALQTAINAATGGATVAVVFDKGNQQTDQFVMSMGGNALCFMDAVDKPQRWGVLAATGGSAEIDFAPCDFTGLNFFAVGYSATAPLRSAMFNDQAAVQDSNAFNAVSPFYFGWWPTAAFPFLGRIRNMAVYPERLVAAGLPGVRALTPFQTPRRPGLLIPDGAWIAPPSGALKIERTQAWSCLANVTIAYTDTTNGLLIFSNTVNAPWGGYEIWLQPAPPNGIGTSGTIRVRIMSDLNGGNDLDVYGSVVVTDGYPHMIAVSYDGSSSAAGVKIYVDGVEDPDVTVVADALTGSILTNSGDMLIGNQTNGSSLLALQGLMNFIAFSDVVRDAGYMAAHGSYAARPAVDADNTLYYDFTEGAGTTLTDKSASGFTGTISGAGAAWY